MTIALAILSQNGGAAARSYSGQDQTGAKSGHAFTAAGADLVGHCANEPRGGNMSEPAKNNRLVVHLTADELREIILDVMKSAGAASKEDRLLTVEQVCEILNCPKDWLYHNAKTLPFTRKAGGLLRFSAHGLQRYIESSKFSVKKNN